MEQSFLLVPLLILGVSLVFALHARAHAHHSSAEEKVLKGYFLLGLSGIMAKIAASDGQVTEDEVSTANRFFAEMDLSDAERAACVGNFLLARHDGLDARDHVRRFLAYAEGPACTFLYDLLWRLARADGTLDPAEDALLKDIARFLGLPETAYERFRRGERPAYDLNVLRAVGVPQAFVGFADKAART